MMDKISFKWTDYSESVSKSFQLLRAEEDFFDVTLVGDDEVAIPAHKLVLSACSSFFKTIFKRTSHTHPLLYLSGISSSNLSLVLDYIYNGEIQIHEKEIDGFMIAAQKLKVKELEMMKKEETKKPTFNVLDFLQKQQVETKIEKEDRINETTEMDLTTTDDESINDEDVEADDFEVIDELELESRLGGIDPNDRIEVENKINEMIRAERLKGRSLYACKKCEKKTHDRSNIKRHCETHIDGLSYKCHICSKSLTTKNAHSKHMKRHTFTS